MSTVAAPVALGQPARLAGALTGAVTALFVVATGASQGGYFATAWGWSAAALGWGAAIVLLLRPEVPLSRLDVAYVGALASFGAWIACSLLWTTSPTQTPLELERALVYVATALLVVSAVRAAVVPAVAGGLLAGLALLALYGLATRLFPERLGTYEPLAGYRLSSPLGYWNALGLAAALGCVLAAALSLRAARPAARAATAATLPPLLLALYFTFSRGGWAALFLALLVLVAYEHRRLSLLAGLAVVASPAAALVAYASMQESLTRQDALVTGALPAGHRVGLALLAASAAAAAAAGLFALLERRLTVPAAVRTTFAVALAVAAVGVLAGGVARYGSPATAAGDAYRSFTARPHPTGSDLNDRLFTLTSNGRWDQWRVALEGWQDEPWLGVGAGGYERLWYAQREYPSKVRDAHGLYVETLAELGPLGLVLVVAALAIPLAAASRARHHPLAPALVAAYVAYLGHAAADWDWEVPTLGLVAIGCGGSLLALARGEGAALRGRPALLALAVLTTLLAIGGLAGNMTLGRSAAAARGDDAATAASLARRAAALAPWSAEPWLRLGDARLAQGRLAAARAAYRRGIAKDGGDYRLWLALAAASSGSERAHAVAEARRLNPLAPEVPRA
jgi:hypothetical protein